MPLRKYQVEANEIVKKEFLNNVKRQIIVMSTGVGKTVCFANLPDLLKDVLPGQMLVIAHRQELIDQSVAKIKAYNPHLNVQKEMAEQRADVSADVIVASVNTLGRKGTKRAERFNWDNIDKIIVDEAHHSTAESYKNILNLSGALDSSKNKLLIGYTATPNRSDGKALAQVYQKITYNYGIRQAIEDGWLVDVRGVRVNTHTNLDNVKTVGGDFAQDMLSDTVNNPQRNELIVKAWLECGEDRRTLGFTVSIKHAKDLADMFQQYDIVAEAVWGDDPGRKEKLKQFSEGDIQVLLNCGVLTEGYDDWHIACILLARPTKSSTLFTQMVGRGTRLEEGTGNLKDFVHDLPNIYLKKDCLVIDVVDASSKHSLITLPTLLGMSTHLDLHGKSLVSAIKSIEEAQKQFPHINFDGLDDIDNLKPYIQSVNLFEVRFPPEVEENSQLSWHGAADGGFVLLLPNKENIKIQQNLLDKYEITAIIKGTKYKGIRENIEDAFIAADTLIYDKAAEHLKILNRKETWHDLPMSQGQLDLLKKFYKGRAIPPNLKRGQASQLISNFLAGKQT